MKPTCKLCETKHWTYEEHQIGAVLDKVQKLGASVLRNTNVTRPTSVTEPRDAERESGGSALVKGGVGSARGFGTGAGQPKKHKTNAERQRAYRERK